MKGLSLRSSEIPVSALPYPSGTWDRIKYYFWHAITPSFLKIRDVLISLHLIHHDVGRQRYLLGTLRSVQKFGSFLSYLQSEGFGNHFIAWKDNDQLVSLRRFDGFERQYHLRIFKDGEVRGHYEFTPEAHPVSHLREIGIEERRTDFLKFLGDWITQEK